jgi:hypothetical protein
VVSLTSSSGGYINGRNSANLELLIDKTSSIYLYVKLKALASWIFLSFTRQTLLIYINQTVIGQSVCKCAFTLSWQSSSYCRFVSITHQALLIIHWYISWNIILLIWFLEINRIWNTLFINVGGCRLVLLYSFHNINRNHYHMIPRGNLYLEGKC